METTQDPRPRMLRRVIIDMLPYTVTDTQILEMQERLGLVPSSLDVLEMDRKESDARIKALQPISEALNTMAGYSAEAIAEYFLMSVGATDDEDDNDEPQDGAMTVPTGYLRSVLVKQNANVIVTAVHGIVSHLVASGVLVFNKELLP